MRFVMTRFFHMSQGRRDASILNAMGSVLDVEMVQGGEVAVVKVGGARCEDGRIINEAYLIACCNGEVISSVAGENSDAQAEIPEVWKEMLKASQCGGEGFLLGRISTGDVTKPRNIHKRVYASNFLRDVAERFVLAHLDPPLSFPVSKQLDAPIVSCVENVGRVNARGEKMVDELALVVTGDSGSVMVLKEIGQSIGTEGGDIRPLWQLLLKCDGGGRSLSKMNGGNVGDRTNYVRIGAEFCSRTVLPSRGWFEIVEECVEYVE
ncbi:hypothetical protein BC829DRAFT_383703 [Chytridium lagenaria]|nr:hypothetical protein BC829DRAFT_383703 [Chytridium lagenaria]